MRLFRPMGGHREKDTDAALLRAVADGDSTAMATLYDRHAGWLHARLTRRCADPEVVREVLQDTSLTGSARRWQGGWDETAAQLHNALLVVVPLAVAAGCRQGGRERRRHTEELWRTAARGPLVRFLASALPIGLWMAAGYLMAAALALLATWPYAQGGRPWPIALPGDAVALAAAALIGQVVGRLVPSRLAAPLLAVASYLGLGFALDRFGFCRSLNPAFPVPDTWVPVWWQPVAMAVWAGGLAAAAVLVHTLRRRSTALLPLAVATAAGALLVQTGDGLWHDDPVARRQVCDTSTTPAVCVNTRYAGLLPQVTDALSGITGRLKGVRNLPVRWEDHPGSPRPDEAELPMVTPFGRSVVRGRLTDPQQYAWEAVAALRLRGDCRERTNARVLRADDAVENYLAPNPLRKAFDDEDARGDEAHRAELRKRRAARARLAAMDEEERRVWLSAYFAARGACDVGGVPEL